MYKRKQAPRRMLVITELEGFEPSNAGVKVLCLTAWRQPNGFADDFTQRELYTIFFKSARQMLIFFLLRLHLLVLR